MTQKRLALIARVSTPTISRFENGAKDIQLSTILTILGVLGLVEKRQVTFPNPEPHYDFQKQTIDFNGVDDSKRIVCRCSREALEDYYQLSEANPTKLLKMFTRIQSLILHLVRKKYFSNQFEADSSILIKTSDLNP